MIIFHGGCHGCLRQDRIGVDSCYDCKYFEAEWNKPDLSERPEDEVDRARKQVKSSRLRARIVSSIRGYGF